MQLKPLLLSAALLLGSTAAVAQTFPLINTQRINFDLQNPPAPVTKGSVTVVGGTGNSTYYVWVVAKFAIGNANPSPSFLAAYAPAQLSGTQYLQANWFPVTGAVGYDVLMTTTAAVPSGPCGCLVATVTGTSEQITSNTTTAYTVTNYSGNATFSVTNGAVGAGESQLSFSAGTTNLWAMDGLTGAWQAAKNTYPVQWASNGFLGSLSALALSTNRTWTLPDESGTIVVTPPGLFPITGTLTVPHIPKATGTGSIGDSSVSDDGTTVSTAEAVSVGPLTATSPAITPTSIEAIKYGDQYTGSTASEKLTAAIASLGSSAGIVVGPPGLGFGQPSSVGANQVLINEQGTSTASPSGLQIVQGGVGEALANNVLFNLKQYSTDPKTIPQNPLYVEQTVSGDLSGNTQNVNWAAFIAGQAQNITAASDFEEEDGAEIEASAIGTGTPPDFRLVSLGAQSWIRNTSADSITIPYAISMWARAPFVSGTGGTASVTNAWSLMATEPEIGTSDNAALVLLTDHATRPLTVELQTAGIPVWEMSVANGSVQTDDFTIGAQSVPTGFTGSDIYLSHGGPEGGTGANAPAYLTSGGTASVIINGEPTHPNGAAHMNGTGGLIVNNGGASGSLAPVASVGLIKIPNNQGMVARDAENLTDITLIKSTSTDKVEIDSNAKGTVAGGTLAWGGGATIASSSSVAPIASPSFTGAPKLPTYTVSGLPSASASGAGASVVVTDATSLTPGACTGGGSNYVLAISNGTSWVCQ